MCVVAVRMPGGSCGWLSPPVPGTSHPPWTNPPGAGSPEGLHSPAGCPEGLPAGGAPSPVPGLRERLRPAPGTGLAAPPPRLLSGSAGGQAPGGQGGERSPAERRAPRRAHRAHRAHRSRRPAAPSAAQPPCDCMVQVSMRSPNMETFKQQKVEDFYDIGEELGR
nr:wiskott-Aldrich syndrome protein-like [Manis javanica]